MPNATYEEIKSAKVTDIYLQRTWEILKTLNVHNPIAEIRQFVLGQLTNIGLRPKS